jgi:hypothetical protein
MKVDAAVLHPTMNCTATHRPHTKRTLHRPAETRIETRNGRGEDSLTVLEQIITTAKLDAARHAVIRQNQIILKMRGCRRSGDGSKFGSRPFVAKMPLS